MFLKKTINEKNRIDKKTGLWHYVSRVLRKGYEKFKRKDVVEVWKKSLL